MLLSDCSNFIVHHCGSRFIICCISSKIMSTVHTLLISFSQKKLAICVKNIFSLTQRMNVVFSFPTTASPTSCEDDEALARAIAASLNDEQPKPKPKRTTATNVCIYITYTQCSKVHVRNVFHCISSGVKCLELSIIWAL